MKKAEIKRRKRVVPANMQQQQQQQAQSSPYHNSDVTDEDAVVYSDSQPSMPRSADQRPDDFQYERAPPGPIPVDFTSSFRAINAPRPHDESAVPRKRSFSVSNHDGEEHPYAHPQNVRTPSRDSNIDPGLSGPPAEVSSKEARRAELQREAEQLRRMMAENERRLAEMEE